MIEERLNKLALSNIYPFHMPGHKRRELEFPNPYAIDITEIEGFDNLHHAEGILREAQEKAARLYDAKQTYYLVNGSTCGILAAISATVPRGGRILVARNSHKAVYNAVYLRQLSPEYVYPADTRCGIQGQIIPKQVEQKLIEFPDIKAVVITSPTYDGIVSDVAGIAEVAHNFGIPLIVDEAHGAHFGFHPAFPENAVKLGADAVIMSVHKTLPAFTQTALLHLCSDRIDHTCIERFLGIYETSSPSYVLMAGIEKSLVLVERQGQELFAQYAGILAEFRNSVQDLKHLWVPGAEDFSQDEAWAFDAGKLLIISRGRMSGQQLQERLFKEYGLQTEMSSGNYVLAMTSLMDRQEGFDRLSRALHAIDAGLHEEEITSFSPREIYCQPEKVMEIYEADEAPHGCVPLAKAVDRVSADTICLYPPGIPLLVPGERIDRKMVETIRRCLELGLDVEGLLENHGINIVQIG
ncbi:MAG: aminotransferase class V-fold PLP-dependent enzyme [Lachnospiraceae bacterium]|nr:aminotransferase class V-fold PLP-dependent enzyme [Lachnospiraceae bacterium]